VLHPLDAAETAQLATKVAGRELDMDSAMRLYRETEGNPLFVVETVRAGLGAESHESGSEAWGLSGPRSPTPDTPSLPPGVYAVIAGRLAQLSAPARELAELAAAIGRPFTLDLLLEAGHADEDSAVHALDELWQRRIVREQGAKSFDFTHDKLREVAYAELSAPQRQLLHRRIAQALEVASGHDPALISGQIAAQYERAGMAEQAIPHYQRAAVVAQRLYANEDAINLLSRDLALLEQLSPGAQRDAQELSLQLALAPLYRMTKGWTSPEVERVLARALALCDTVGDDTQRAQVCYGLQSLYVVQAKLENVQLVSDDLHRLYQQTQGAPPPLVAEMMLTGSRLHLGRLTDASAEFEQMIATHDPTQLQRIVEEQGWNYAVHARAWHAHALWLLGYPQSALRRGHNAARLAHDLAQPFNQAVAAAYLALLQQLCADDATARAHADQALALTTEYKAPYYRAWSAILVSYALACEQPDAPTIARLRESIAAFTATGARLRLPYYLGLLAHVCGRAGRAEEGLAAINEAMAASRAHSERWWDAELQRLRGELLLDRGADAYEVEAAYLRAMEIASAQQARALELRAVTSLARLWRAQKRADDARRLLDGVYSWFTEGFDTPDLQAAQLLLAQL
jgi:predicted ATPase